MYGTEAHHQKHSLDLILSGTATGIELFMSWPGNSGPALRVSIVWSSSPGCLLLELDYGYLVIIRNASCLDVAQCSYYITRNKRGKAECDSSSWSCGQHSDGEPRCYLVTMLSKFLVSYSEDCTVLAPIFKCQLNNRDTFQSPPPYASPFWQSFSAKRPKKLGNFVHRCDSSFSHCHIQMHWCGWLPVKATTIHLLKVCLIIRCLILTALFKPKTRLLCQLDSSPFYIENEPAKDPWVDLSVNSLTNNKCRR